MISQQEQMNSLFDFVGGIEKIGIMSLELQSAPRKLGKEDKSDFVVTNLGTTSRHLGLQSKLRKLMISTCLNTQALESALGQLCFALYICYSLNSH